jgi:hypothetical protein
MRTIQEDMQAHMTPADCYDLAAAGCNDEEILAAAEPMSLNDRRILKAWLGQVRMDERLAGPDCNLRSDK